MPPLKFRVAILSLFLGAVTFMGPYSADASTNEPPPVPKADRQLPGFFRYLTDDFEVLFYFNAESLRRADAFPKLRQNVEEGLAKFGRQFQQESGLELTDVTRLAATFRHGKIDDGVIAIETAQPQSIEDLLQRRKRAAEDKNLKFEELRPLTIGAYKAYLPEKVNDVGVCFPDERTVVYGTKTTLQKVLLRDRKVFPNVLQSAIENEDYAKTLVVIVDTRDPVRAGITDLDPDRQCQLIQVETVVGATVDTVVTLHYREAKHAERGKELIQDLAKIAAQIEIKTDADVIWTVLAKAKCELRDSALVIATALTAEHFNRVLSALKNLKQQDQKPAPKTVPTDS